MIHRDAAGNSACDSHSSLQSGADEELILSFSRAIRSFSLPLAFNFLSTNNALRSFTFILVSSSEVNGGSESSLILESESARDCSCASSCVSSYCSSPSTSSKNGLMTPPLSLLSSNVASSNTPLNTLREG